MTRFADPWTAAEAEARQRQSDRRFMLTIAGIPYQFHNGESAPVQVYDATPAPDAFYTGLHCLTRLADINWRVEDAGEGPGARVVYDPQEVTLHHQPELAFDIRRYFNRQDRDDATWWAQVTATVTGADPVEIFIDQDPTGLTFPHYFFVGKQVVRATGQAVAGSGWKLTGCTRGAGDTLSRSIKADAVTGRTPLITAEPTHFDGRDATLWWQAYPGDTWRELLPGRIHGEPVVKGNAITLMFNPLPNVLDSKLSPDALATEIITSHHLFQRIGCRVEHVQHIPEDAAFSEAIDAGTLANSAQVQSLAGRTEHTKFFDIVSSGNLGTGHPRNGPIFTKRSSPPYEPISYQVAPPFDGFNTPPLTPPIAITVQDRVRNAEVAEVIQAKIADDSPGAADELIVWPGGLADAINDSEGWNRAAHTGEYGSWMRLVLNLQGPALFMLRNVPGGYINVHRYRDVQPSNPDAQVWERDAAGDWQSFEPTSRQRLPAAVWAPVTEGGESLATIQPLAASKTVTDVPQPARAFYLPREAKFITADALTVPSALGSLTVRLQAGDRVTEARVTAVAQQLDGGGSLVGYACTLDERHVLQQPLPLLVQGVNDDPIRVTPLIRAFDGTSGSLMLQIICSVEGDGVNGAYDTLITGLGVREALVDTASFLSIQDPPDVDWRPIFGDGQTVLEFFRVVGLMTSSVVDIVRSADGTARLTRISLQPSTDPPPLGALGVAQYPSSRATDVIRNVIEWSANPDPETGKPTWTWTSRDQASIAEFGARDPLKLQIPGYIPTDSASRTAVLRSLDVRVFARYGRRRRVWQVFAPTDALLRQHALAPVGVTTDKLIDQDGDFGVSNQPTQAMKLSIGLMTEGGAIELEPNFIAGSYWNVSALVVGVDGAPFAGTDLVTYPNAETIELSPTADGQADSDASYFVVGDEIYCAPAGDTDNGITRTVIGVHEANDRVTLNDSSGFAGPDYGDIWTTDYDNASTTRRERVIPQAGAFFADAAGTLGAAGDDGRETL